MKAPEIHFSTPDPALEQIAESYRMQMGATPADAIAQQTLTAGKVLIGPTVAKWGLPSHILAIATKHLDTTLPALTPEFHALSGSTLRTGWEAQLLADAKNFFAAKFADLIPHIEPLAHAVVAEMRTELRKLLPSSADATGS